jgi:AcrR family transcriptional regulator
MTPSDGPPSARDEGEASGRRLMRRSERRGQILAAAKSAFLRSGFAATGLEDVADEAGVTKVLIYRHFDSKADLYRAALEDTRGRVRSATGGAGHLEEDSFGALATVAGEDPDGFRLLFRHAAREPAFRAGRRRWAAGLVPVLTLETIMAWLDAGRPAPEEEVSVAVNATVDGFLGAMPSG